MDLESRKCWDTSKVSALTWKSYAKTKHEKCRFALFVVSSLSDKGLVGHKILVQNGY